MGGLDLACPINRLPCYGGIQWVLARITNSFPGVGTDRSPHKHSILKKHKNSFKEGNIMDKVDIEDLTIEQYLRLTQENQTPKKIEDMTIAEYVEYEKKMNENHISNTKTYLPTYSSKSAPTHDPIQEFAHYFVPNQPGAESDCDSKDMDEEVEYMTDDEVVMSDQEESNHGNTQNIQHFEEKDDLDIWLNAKITKHLSIQGVENTEDALISIIKSIKKEMKDDIMKNQIEASTANIGNKTSSITSNEVDTDDNNTSPTTSYLLPKELSLGNYLLPFNIDDHSLYAITTLEAKDNIMPIDVYKYLGLDTLGDAGTVENTIGTNEPLGAIDILIKFKTLEFLCNFVIKMADDVIILGRPSLESTHTQINVFNEEISFEIGSEKLRGLRMWICFRDHERRTMKGSYMGFADFLQEHLEQEEKEYLPIRPRPCNYSFEEWLKIRIGHNNLHESDREFIFNEWILDSYDVEEEYAREIGKKGYVLDDVWEKCQQNYKKINKAWHDKAYEEDEMWRIREENENKALPLGRVNRARFKAMIRKELEGNKIQKLRGNYRDRLNSYSFGSFSEIATATKWFKRLVAYAKCNRDSYESELGDKELAGRRR
ncbi:phospholipase-like protein [Tanacetum coccineum]